MTTHTAITETEIQEAQHAWADGILHIRTTYANGGNHTAEAKAFIDKHYAYELGPVLFKPTLASIVQFRTDPKGALSYFVGGDDDFPEDRGFAILPWTAIRFEPVAVHVVQGFAVSMGNYFLTNESGEVIKVEFTMGFVRDNEGLLKIALHHSSVPYTPFNG